MGRPVKPVALQSASDAPGSSAGQLQVAPQQHRVDLGDGAAIKRILDETAGQEVLHSVNREDFTVSNLKLGLGVLTCCWALLAQFYPKKYPHNWHVLVLSLACYLVCTASLSALSWFMERDSFLFACKVPGQQQGSILSLASLMPKYQDMYTLQFQSRDSLISKPRMVTELSNSVTKYFDSEGLLLEDAFRQDVRQKLQQYTATSKKHL
jgi:signal peptidase complex subunit 2